MTFDPVSYSEIKKLGKPIVKSSAPPSSTDVIWYDETTNCYRGFNEKTNQWNIVSKFGVDWFDNFGAGTWTNYIEIPIQTAPTEDIQYLIEINGTTVSVYSNDLTNTLVSSTINNFWNNVQTNGYDIRVFDETFEQNFFWIEEFDYSNQVAKIWVKLNAGQELIGITFGNPYAENSLFNDGEQTFEFFDDFNGTSLDTEKWTIGDGNPSVSDSILTLNWDGTTMDYIYTNIGIESNYIINCKWLYGPSNVRCIFNIVAPVDSSGAGYASNFDTGTIDYCNIYSMSSWTSWSILTTYQDNPAAETWHYSNVIIKTSSITVINDGTTYFDDYSIDTSGKTYIGLNPDRGDTHHASVDYIFIRKYIPSDLSFGTPTLKSF